MPWSTVFAMASAAHEVQTSLTWRHFSSAHLARPIGPSIPNSLSAILSPFIVLLSHLRFYVRIAAGASDAALSYFNGLVGQPFRPLIDIGLPLRGRHGGFLHLPRLDALEG